jgi:hypothetical protein
LTAAGLALTGGRALPFKALFDLERAGDSAVMSRSMRCRAGTPGSSPDSIAESNLRS